MDTITFFQSNKISSPNPLTLVCSLTPDGKTNLAPISWWTKLSFTPEMVGFAMAKTSYSGDLIRANKKAVLAMPTEELAAATMACGGSTGRNTDKVTKFAIDMQPLDGSAIQIPVHCCLAIACSITEVVEVGDHYLYIGAVDGIRGDLGKKALFAWDEDSVSLRPAR